MVIKCANQALMPNMPTSRSDLAAINSVIDVEAVEVIEPVNRAQLGALAGPCSRVQIFRLSWVAFLPKVWRFTAFSLVSFLLLVAIGSRTIFLFLLAANVVWLGKEFAVVRSTAISIDDHGVWLSRGLFPWSRSYAGLVWRDVGLAMFKQDLASWLTSSYTLYIRHRFQGGPDLVLSHVVNGHIVADQINQQIVFASRQNP